MIIDMVGAALKHECVADLCGIPCNTEEGITGCKKTSKRISSAKLGRKHKSRTAREKDCISIFMITNARFRAEDGRELPTRSIRCYLHENVI